MLEPREADIPLLFLVLIVLPLVTYILLGKWNESANKKSRISMLAQLAAEEALRVEATASVDVIPIVPLSKTGFHECAKCFAPATTRCSRCKSVRYCSGKCQIIHWRQGHKLECQHWQDRSLVRSAGRVSNQFLDIEDDIFSDISNDASFTTIDASQDSEAERMLLDSEKQVSNEPQKETFRSDDNSTCAFEEGISFRADTPTLCPSTMFRELSPKDAPLGHKLETGVYGTHRYQDTSSPIYAHAPSSIRNVAHQSRKLTGDMRNVLRTSCSPDNPENVINECETGMKLSSERLDCQDNGFSTARETLDLNSSAEDIMVKGNIMYKRPPYVLGSTTSLSQKSSEKVPREYQSQGVPATSVSTNIPLQSCNGISNMGGLKIAGSRKSSKAPKRNLLGLINNYNKTKVLFPYEDLVKFFQCELGGISPRGLLNCGNSCYANAVLQCLTCTKPLMIYLLRRSHSKTCRVSDWCLMCELEQHVSMLREGGSPLSPSRFLSNMRNIGCRMGGGNQEDAHEFLRLLVMSMQSICLEGLGGEKEVDPRLQETTLIQQIFGGRLKSKVKCLRCHLESERYENIMDLTLEIHGWVESLEDALTQFTAPEDLDGENMYRCGRCLAYVKARKQLSVHEVPNILTIVLKRFQTGNYGKLNKCVTFPDMLDMIPFVSGTADSPPLYMLYAVVVHLDTLNASFSGHYVSYVKDLQGTWFRIDDSEVRPVPLSQVMSEGAYMLFYSRSFPRPPRAYFEKPHSQASTKHATPKSQKTSRHGQPKQSGTSFASENSINTVNGFRVESRNVNASLPREEAYSDSVSMDFSDATSSSDWSLFTSSDESSCTTESTRDSFSTVDHGDSAGLDPISSIFGPPFYVPEYPQSNTISCTKFSPCKPQTRFFSERKGVVLDFSMPTQPLGGVHKGRVPEEVDGYSASKCSLYGRYGSNPKEGFVQTSGSCGL